MQTSRGLDPRELQAGRHLVLELEEAHGTTVPRGVYSQDHVDLALRAEIDAAAGAFVTDLHDRYGAALTVGGVCLPHVLAQELVSSAAVPLLSAGVGTLLALRTVRPDRLELGPCVPGLAAVVRAAAVAESVHVVDLGGDVGVTGAAVDRRLVDRRVASPPRRRRVLGALHGSLPIPSQLRAAAVPSLGYWSLAAVLDRMLDDPEWRPAAHLEARPPGPWRGLRVALQGGWIGSPGPSAVERRSRQVADAVARLEREEPMSRPVAGVDWGPAVMEAMLGVIAAQGGRAVARAEVAAAAFARGRVRSLLLPFDSPPFARLLTATARSAGVRSLALSHGGYWVASIVQDLETADAVAVWSDQIRPMLRRPDSSIHIVGYPGARSLSPGTDGQDASLTAVVLLQPPLLDSALIDWRMAAQHYDVAVRAVRAVEPEARIVLRPHPSRGPGDASDVVAAVHGAAVQVDRTSDILALLARARLCVGSLSTATLQAALVDVPVVALDLTGLTWPWPLAGDSSVPVARTGDELTEFVAAALRGDVLAGGREELLAALGADRPFAVDAVLELLR